MWFQDEVMSYSDCRFTKYNYRGGLVHKRSHIKKKKKETVDTKTNCVYLCIVIAREKVLLYSCVNGSHKTQLLNVIKRISNVWKLKDKV